MDDERFESLLAVNAAHETTLVLLIEAVMIMSGIQDGSAERTKLVGDWIRDAHKMLDHTRFQSLKDDAEARIIERAKMSVSDLFESIEPSVRGTHEASHRQQ